jgi:hypothetical protein
MMNPAPGGPVEIPATPLTLSLEVRWRGSSPGGAWEGDAPLAGLDIIVPGAAEDEAEQVFSTLRITVERSLPGRSSDPGLSHVDTGTWASYDAADFIVLRIPAADSTLAALAQEGQATARLIVSLTGHAAIRGGTLGVRAPGDGEPPSSLVLARRTVYAATVHGLPE